MGGAKLTLLLFFGAIASGAAAAYFAGDYIDDRLSLRQAELEEQYKPESIVVPKADLKAGAVLTYDLLAVRKAPSGFLHKQAIRPEAVEAVIGHRLLHPLNSGEALLQMHVSEGRGAGLSTMVGPGKRALSFSVDNVSSMSGMIRPGDKIDLLVTLTEEGKRTTFPLVRDTLVLAAGGHVDAMSAAESGHFGTLTLLVSAEESAKITHAREIGSLTVVLRAPSDPDQGRLARITADTLLGNQERGGQKKVVEIIRGGK